MAAAPRFLLATCQRGAEAPLKQELALRWPGLSASFSRPGFVTFKVSPDLALPDDLDLGTTFARSWNWSLGKLAGSPAEWGAQGETVAPRLAEMAAKSHDALDKQGTLLPFEQVFVSCRDAQTVGDHGYEPGPTAETIAATEFLRTLLPGEILRRNSDGDALPLRAGQRVLEVIQVEPDEWWCGWHTIRRGAPWTRWPGGIFQCEPPPDMVSRAYVKMREALATWRFPIERNQIALEIGSAPGGASQALLRAGLRVIGVDPAQMDERVLAERKFKHWRRRGHEIRKTALRGVRWITADINVTPQYTLDTIGGIVTNQHVRAEGLILTLKLPDYRLAAELPDFLATVKSWGYAHVQARQLSHNRQECCVAALR
ncbi:MAG: SAM-dependent methyltransferase [Pirellulales bacterium]|nr:SAM-dependent methyltransferase [Pirellulales bacterium]